MLFRVNTRVLNKGEWREVFYLAESDHDTMADLHDALVRDGVVHITRIDTRGPNEREVAMMGVARRARFVTDEYEVILHRDGFTQISEPMEDLIGSDGEPIFLMSVDAPHRGVAAAK